MRRVAILASASGNGKTTLGRELARRLDVPFHELDALHHGPGWTEATADELRARVEPLVAEDEWVVDGRIEASSAIWCSSAPTLVVWLDLPLRVWLPRLLRRTCEESSGARCSGTATARRCATFSSVATR